MYVLLAAGKIKTITDGTMQLFVPPNFLFGQISEHLFFGHIFENVFDISLR